MPRRILYYPNTVKAESRDKSRNKVFQDLTLPRRILYYLNIVKAECRDFSKNKVFQHLTLPGRILYYPNTVKAECRDFSKNKVFQHLTLPRRILYYLNIVKAAGRDFSKTHVLIFDSVEAQHIHFSNIENTLRKAKPRIAARTYTPSRFLLSDTLHALQDTKKTPAKASFSSHDAPAAANRPPRRRNTYPPSGRRSRGAPSS